MTRSGSRESLGLAFRRRIGGSVVASLAVAILLAGCSSGSASPSPTATASAYRGAVLSKPIASPDFTLADTAGRRYNFRASTAGHVALLYFGYTNCTDVCPTNMAAVAAALRQLPPPVADVVDVIFVTTDPARDTTSHLRTWLDQFDTRFTGLTGLTGTPDAIQVAERESGIPPSAPEPPVAGNYSVSHAAYIIAFAQDGLGHLVYPSGMSPSDIAQDLASLVKSGWTSPGGSAS